MEENLTASSSTTTDVSTVIIDTINSIFSELFSSIDDNLFSVLDDLTFVNSDILDDKYFGRIFGTSAGQGILLISNALLIGFVLYFAVKYISSNFTNSRIENPVQFIFKMVIFGACMNCSFFIIGQVLDINSNISLIIRSIGEDLFNKDICFSNLVNSINENLNITEEALNIFSVDGLIKGTVTFSLINLVAVYALRYIMIKIFVLLTPFAILSLCLESTSWFFKLWFKNLFSLLFIQIIVSLTLVILFSIDYTTDDLMTKFIYLGGIYALIKANSFVREFMIGSGISTNAPGIVKGINR